MKRWWGERLARLIVAGAVVLCGSALAFMGKLLPGKAPLRAGEPVRAPVGRHVWCLPMSLARVGPAGRRRRHLRWLRPRSGELPG